MRTSGFMVAALLAVQAVSASTISYTGTLASPEDASTVITVTLEDAGTLDLQTYGFGGGTNAASEVIAPGGFDPFVGVFSGTGDSAEFIDGTSDILSNYAADEGCPPAGTVKIGDAVCGDVALSEVLAAGTYTVLLTDGDYIPNAAFDDGTLGEGFDDLTGGAFQTCNTVGPNTTCVNDTAAWALDITAPDQSPAAPEPGGPCAFAIALVAWGTAHRRFTRFKNGKLNH
jgi:hypothetical protein